MAGSLGSALSSAVSSSSGSRGGGFSSGGGRGGWRRRRPMKIKILYDNTSFVQGVIADWGFSCLVELMGEKYFSTPEQREQCFFKTWQNLVYPLYLWMRYLFHMHTGIIPEVWLN
jgi:hypothetical protein